ncbi:MAG: hypothetical protein Q9190_001319 [Brigantiaea leucoxantha]
MSDENSTRREFLEKESVSSELKHAQQHPDNQENKTEVESQAGAQGKVIVYLKGWRLHTVILGLCLGVFLSTIETTIVSTALVAITNTLNGFQKNNWIVTSYLLTYSGFLIILSKFSDIFGRKPLLLLTVFLFTVFSAACGAAQTFEQLAILRAFQGIGGGGIYTLVFAISLQIVPPDGLPLLSAIISVAVPPGAFLLVLLAMSMPAGFPYESHPSQGILTYFKMAALRKVDFLGTILLLAASVLLVSALEEGGTEYPWKSAAVLSTFCISVVLWILFLAWEKFASGQYSTQEPVLPWRLLINRITMGFLLNALFGGAVFICSVILIPQRFQVVNNLSAFNAGWRLLALMLCSPVGTILSGTLVTKFKIPPIYVFLIAAVLQTVGLALMGTLPISSAGVPSAQYGYQVILGLGIGLGLATLIVAAPTAIEEKDTAVFVGAITQSRILGGSLGLAVCTNVLNSKVKSASSSLTSQQLNDLIQSAQTIKNLAPNVQELVRRKFGEGYNEQMQVLTAFGGAAVLATLMMWEKQPRRMK